MIKKEVSNSRYLMKIVICKMKQKTIKKGT